jgi:excisionase family DNA binding protein
MHTIHKMTGGRRHDPTAATGRVAYSIVEVCALTGLCRDTVYGAIRAGRLTARKLGRRTLVTECDLRCFIDELPKLPKQVEGA